MNRIVSEEAQEQIELTINFDHPISSNTMINFNVQTDAKIENHQISNSERDFDIMGPYQGDNRETADLDFAVMAMEGATMLKVVVKIYDDNIQEKTEIIKIKLAEPRIVGSYEIQADGEVSIEIKSEEWLPSATISFKMDEKLYESKNVETGKINECKVAAMRFIMEDILLYFYIKSLPATGFSETINYEANPDDWKLLIIVRPLTSSYWLDPQAISLNYTVNEYDAVNRVFKITFSAELRSYDGVSKYKYYNITEGSLELTPFDFNSCKTF